MNFIKVRLKAALKNTYKFFTHYYCYECEDYTVKLEKITNKKLIFKCKSCNKLY